MDFFEFALGFWVFGPIIVISLTAIQLDNSKERKTLIEN